MYNLLGIDGTVPQETVELIEKMKTGSIRNKRLSAFLLDLMSKGRTYFASKEYFKYFKLSDPALSNDLRLAVDYGILDYKLVIKHSMYYIPDEIIPDVRVKDLTLEMKALLTEIYQRFGRGEFTARQIPKNTTRKKLVRRGVISMERKNQTYVYRLLVTPETHPECFGTAVPDPQGGQ